MNRKGNIFTGILIILAICQSVMASTTSEVYISCTVASFGGYVFKGYINAPANKPGENVIGYIDVEGAANEPYPWIMRVYTDNRNYQGTAGAIHQKETPQGLVRQGGGNLPIRFKTPNTGDEWVYIPDINNENRLSYFAVRDMGPGATIPSGTTKDTLLMGIDPRNAEWVAGPDSILFTDDDNLYGDISIGTPFKINLQVILPKDPQEIKKIPAGKYSTKLIFEIISEP